MYLKLNELRPTWKEFTLPDIEMRWEMQFAVECKGKIICSDSFFGRTTYILEKEEEGDELRLHEKIESNLSSEFRVNNHAYNFKVFRGEVFAVEPA